MRPDKKVWKATEVSFEPVCSTHVLRRSGCVSSKNLLVSERDEKAIWVPSFFWKKSDQSFFILAAANFVSAITALSVSNATCFKRSAFERLLASMFGAIISGR